MKHRECFSAFGVERHAFRARAGAAPLKQHDHGDMPDKPKCAFRARAGAAPLKRHNKKAMLVTGTGIPRPRGRGPVEAPTSGRREETMNRRIPRPRGRGPVEANNQGTVVLVFNMHSAPARARPR